MRCISNDSLLEKYSLHALHWFFVPLSFIGNLQSAFKDKFVNDQFRK